MRPRSMTGFGRGEASADGRTWVAEVRTVNHRFLDQRVVLPRLFGALEEPVKKLVAGALDRGRVDVTFSLQGMTTSQPQLVVNDSVARQYHRCLRQLIGEYGLRPEVGLGDMLTLRDVITLEEPRPDMEAEWQLIRTALAAALRDCDRMREEEGRALQADLLDRLGSHIGQFRTFLASDEPVGRRLDFLLQEFLREVNTLSSKIANADIAHLGVEMKNEIEKLREQVQNIE